MPDYTMKGITVGKTDIRQVHVYPGATGAYQAGDAVGTLLTFENVSRGPGGGLILSSVVVGDKDDQKAALKLILMQESLASSDLVDNTAAAQVDADVSKVLGAISISTGDYVDIGGASIATVFKTLPLVSKSGSRHIYGYLISAGAPTYSTDGLLVTLGFTQD